MAKSSAPFPLHVRQEGGCPVLPDRGTQSTLADLLRFETEAQTGQLIPGQPIDDIREVSNYVDATMHGLERLGKLPLSLRLIREMHARLLQSSRGRSTANQASDAATHIVELFKRDRERIAAESDRPGSALRVHELLQQNGFLTSNLLVERTGLSAPTINAALAGLERLGIVEEVTGRRRGRVFGYSAYLAILGEGTEPLPTAAPAVTPASPRRSNRARRSSRRR